MTKCEKCGKETSLPFYCIFCNREFCADHRLPETHDCNTLSAKQPFSAPSHRIGTVTSPTKPRKKHWWQR